MKSRICFPFACPMVLMVTIATGAMMKVRAEVLFQDDFSYADRKEIVQKGKWVVNNSEGGGLDPGLASDTEFNSTQYLKLSPAPRPNAPERNGFIYHAFTPAPDGSAVTLSVKMLSMLPNRTAVAGLFDAERKVGYIISWFTIDAGTGGTVQLRRIEQETPALFNSSGTVVAVGKKISHVVGAGPLADFVVKFDPATSSITVTMDGRELFRYKETKPLPVFATVALRGSEGSLFDDVSVAAE